MKVYDIGTDYVPCSFKNI